MSLIKHVSCFHIHQIDFPVLLQNFNRNYYWKIKQYRWKIFIQLGVSKMFDGEIIIIYKHFSMYIINEMCMNLLSYKFFQKIPIILFYVKKARKSLNPKNVLRQVRDL